MTLIIQIATLFIFSKVANAETSWSNLDQDFKSISCQVSARNQVEEYSLQRHYYEAMGGSDFFLAADSADALSTFAFANVSELGY